LAGLSFRFICAGVTITEASGGGLRFFRGAHFGQYWW
jgi:hypothetical protein